MESKAPFGIFDTSINTEPNDYSSYQQNEEKEDELDLKMKITLIVAACIAIVLVIYFSLLYFCRQCTKTARYADVSSRFKTSNSFKYRPSALVMVLNNQNDITNYWDSEVNLENDCASVPESVQVSITKTEV